MNKNVINWHEYFMGVSKLSALRSKDPSTQVGACIVNQRKRIVGIGYNGLTFGMDDKEFHWNNRESKSIENSKYPYIIHAEANAILNAVQSLQDCTIYVSLFPCNECAKLIIQSGIRTVIYESDKYQNDISFKISRKLLSKAGVKLIQLNTQVNVHVDII